jgi:23S rRNA (cytosine1962-C5)-methyltransferase
VLDRYDQTLVLKLYTAAWVPHLRTFAAALQREVLAERLLLRLGRTATRFPDDLYGLTDGAVLWGAELAGPVTFLENGLRFEADPLHGHKTGFYLDQRENRARVEQLAKVKSVLNVFAYTGGFALYAARGGARSILSVDISRPALEAAERNFSLNQDVRAVARAKHVCLTEDAFAALERLGRARQRFDLVILDPPAFANQRSEVERALAAYARLTPLALGVLRRGGTLVYASCTRQVSADAFFEAVHLAAQRAGRPLRDIERTGHPLDHPVLFKEGAYLKCLFAEAP